MENILERLGKMAVNKGITISSLEKKIGASKGVLSRALSQKTDIQAKWVVKIVENYPEISPEWLLTGKGEMLKSEVNTNQSEHMLDMIPAKVSGIPLVNINAVAGFGNADFAIAEADVKDYYVVPKFKYCHVDFMIEISGSSMYPKYNSGDVVACTILHERAFIQWNKCHIIATREQGILCKRLRPSEQQGYITAVSDNKDYPPFDIPTSEITGIALVCGVIRLE